MSTPKTDAEIAVLYALDLDYPANPENVRDAFLAGRASSHAQVRELTAKIELKDLENRNDSFLNKSEIARLTRQRDLAVESLKECINDESNGYSIDRLFKETFELLKKVGGHQNCYAVNAVLSARKAGREALAEIQALEPKERE
jgi:hypothetical protein